MKTPCIAIHMLIWKARFWIEIFLTCQISNWKRSTARQSPKKKKNTTGQISSWDFPTCQILNQLLNAPQILNWTFFNVSGLNKLSEHAPEFHFKFLLRVRFRIEKKHHVRIRNKKKPTRLFSEFEKYNASEFELKFSNVSDFISTFKYASDFELKTLQRVRF